MVKRMLNAKGVTGDGEALAKCRGVRRMRLCGERIEWIEDAEVTDCVRVEDGQDSPGPSLMV